MEFKEIEDILKKVNEIVKQWDDEDEWDEEEEEEEEGMSEDIFLEAGDRLKRDLTEELIGIVKGYKMDIEGENIDDFAMVVESDLADTAHTYSYFDRGDEEIQINIDNYYSEVYEYNEDEEGWEGILYLSYEMYYEVGGYSDYWLIETNVDVIFEDEDGKYIKRIIDAR